MSEFAALALSQKDALNGPKYPKSRLIFFTALFINVFELRYAETSNVLRFRSVRLQNY
jgi:hypothetical protein